MSDASELRGYAAQCMACARTQEPGARSSWLEMAQKWQRLAEQAEQAEGAVAQQQQQIQPKK